MDEEKVISMLREKSRSSFREFDDRSFADIYLFQVWRPVDSVIGKFSAVAAIGSAMIDRRTNDAIDGRADGKSQQQVARFVVLELHLVK